MSELSNTRKLKNIVLLANLTEIAVELTNGVITKNPNLNRDGVQAPVLRNHLREAFVAKLSSKLGVQ